MQDPGLATTATVRARVAKAGALAGMSATGAGAMTAAVAAFMVSALLPGPRRAPRPLPLRRR